jgi:hypothetical protein
LIQDKQRNRISIALAAVVVALVPLPGASQTPSYFPIGTMLDTTAYSLRIAGTNRFATAAAMGLVSGINQITTTGWPFHEPNKTDASKAYGFNKCPKGVGVAAGDVPADALAAASAWQVSFEAPKDAGGTGTLNTQDGVLLLTESGRDGAFDLSTYTITVLQRLVARGCSFDAVIFGGKAAVPQAAADTLDLFAGTVFRIAGTDRFDTARKIATSIFTGPLGSALPDIPFWDTPGPADRTLRDVVFLAEGYTGADALAVGPYAAEVLIPMLLTSPSSLPNATRSALALMRPKTIVTIGGTGAISTTVASAAAAAAGGAAVVRVGGTDRYETSVLIAKRLHGYWPQDAGGAKFENLTFGVARSEGSRDQHVGWPDALTSAWFLGNYDDLGLTPIRQAPPIEKNTGTTPLGGDTWGTPPLLLVQQGRIPSTVEAYLKGLWPDPTKMRTASNPAGQNRGGFAFVFGGTGAITTTVARSVSTSLSGGTYTVTEQTDFAPVLTVDKLFFTAADMASYVGPDSGGGLDNGGSSGAGDKVCVLREGLAGAEWLALYEADGPFVSAVPADYQDPDTAYPAFKSRMVCSDRLAVADAEDDKTARAFAISLSGKEVFQSLDWSDPMKTLSTTAGQAAAPPTTFTPAVDPTADVVDGGTAQATYKWVDGSFPFGITYKGTTSTGSFDLTLSLVRTDPAGPGGDRVTFTGTLVVKGGGATLFTASVQGESASLLSPLQLVGMYSTTPGGARGGFHVRITGIQADANVTDLVADGLA